MIKMRTGCPVSAVWTVRERKCSLSLDFTAGLSGASGGRDARGRRVNDRRAARE
jgi:hypothetical protein